MVGLGKSLTFNASQVSELAKPRHKSDLRPVSRELESWVDQVDMDISEGKRHRIFKSFRGRLGAAKSIWQEQTLKHILIKTGY